MNILIAAAMPTLVALYSAPKRYYHNLDHINFCLGRLEWAKLQPEFSSFTEDAWETLEIAIWFHDAVYNPHAQQVKSGYSEEQSAQFLLNFMDLEFEYRLKSDLMPMVETAVNMIRWTGRHINNRKEQPSKMVQLMLDIDLAGLGLTWDQFVYNTENVCMEYEMSESNSEQLRIMQGNSGFQQALCRRERIFYTDTFHNQYEEQARKNIAQRVAQVEQMVEHDKP